MYIYIYLVVDAVYLCFVDLCLTEKLLIAKADRRKLFNKKSEIMSKCRHRNKFTLKRFR